MTTAIAARPVCLAASPVQTIAKLTPEVNAHVSIFGVSVSVDHKTSLIGARGPDLNGLTYVYRDVGEDQWENVAALSGPASPSRDGFGMSTSLSGSTALIGAPLTPGGGAAYVFQEQAHGQWDRVANLSPLGAVSGSDFGWSVAVDGPTALSRRIQREQLSRGRLLVRRGR